MSINKEDLYIGKQNETYMDWLKSIVRTEEHFNYNCLLQSLWDIYYVPAIGNDIDRKIDGLSLRDEYAMVVSNTVGGNSNVSGLKLNDIYGPCRVLEMLIGLSERMYDIMYDVEDVEPYNTIGRWFWSMISNVGLDICTDDFFNNHPDCGTEIRELVEDILRSEDHGMRYPGGWFHIRGWWRMELWYQMSEYINQFFV